MSVNKVMSMDEAIAMIKDGDTIWINAFLALANPKELGAALTARFRESGYPQHLEVFCSAGFGDWTKDSAVEGYIVDGAVDRLVLGHFSSMPDTSEKIKKNEVEAYNLPLGVMSHMIRAAASRKNSLRSKIGLNLYVDPRNGGSGMNQKSQFEWAQLSYDEYEGEQLIYKVPKIDVALIKGSSVDRNGNISFEDECVTVDALSCAQAARANGGKVIVQVARKLDRHQRPRNVIIPGALVDAVVICHEQEQIIAVSGYNASLSGDVYVRENEMSTWASALEGNMTTRSKGRLPMHTLIARRAFRELKQGQIANIGLGIPELVGTIAINEGMLSKVTLSVESGATGGLPASGRAFGATIGADSIVDMAQQFDFYDGGGLDICFIGALEVDAKGNVNGHISYDKLSGIGGFANITQTSKTVVFCFTFSAKGLTVDTNNGVHILSEGSYPKIVQSVHSISFSARNARENGQKVLYVTERCVFELTEAGLILTEIYKGVDLERDILDRIPFSIAVSDDLKISDPMAANLWAKNADLN